MSEINTIQNTNNNSNNIHIEHNVSNQSNLKQVNDINTNIISSAANQLLEAIADNFIHKNDNNVNNNYNKYNNHDSFTIEAWQEGIKKEYQYINLLIVLTIAFFSTAYYFFLFKKQKNNLNTQLRENLVYAFLIKGFSLLYSVITVNPKGNDLKSFINYVLFHFSTIYFQCLLLDYVRLLIEKYYYLKVRKYDSFLKDNFYKFKLGYYCAFFFFGALFILNSRYLVLDYTFFLLNGACGVFISFLFLYYGISLARIYDNTKNNTNNRILSNLHSNSFNVNSNNYDFQYSNLNNINKLLTTNTENSSIYNKNNKALNNNENNINMPHNQQDKYHFNYLDDQIHSNNNSKYKHFYTNFNAHYHQTFADVEIQKLSHESRTKLRYKLLAVSLTAAFTHFIQGVSFFILGVNYFGDAYFKLINPNLFDFLTITFGTYVCGVVIGYTKISSKLTAKPLQKKLEYKEDLFDNSLKDSLLDTTTQQETDHARKENNIITANNFFNNNNNKDNLNNTTDLNRKDILITGLENDSKNNVTQQTGSFKNSIDNDGKKRRKYFLTKKDKEKMNTNK